MTFAAMTAEQWVSLLTPIAVAISIIFQKMQSQKVKVALDDAATKSDDKLNAIHGLVDGNMTEQKRVTAMQAKRIAILTNDPADQAIAEDSKRAYENHQNREQQAVSEALPSQSRLLVTDGSTIKMVNDRLGTIETLLGGLPCREGSQWSRCVTIHDQVPVGSAPIVESPKSGKVQP